MNAVTLAILVATANVLGAGMIVPQARRLRRSRSTDGVSPAWVGVGIIMNLWWTIYAITGAVWGVLPVSVVAGALYGVMAVDFVRLVGPSAVRGMLIGAAGVGSIPLVFLAVGGWPMAGIGIGLCYGIQFSPAVLTALRSRSVDGISPVTWAMAWGEAVIWVIYGSVIVDPALLVGGGGGAAMAAIILVRIAVDRVARQRRQLIPLA